MASRGKIYSQLRQIALSNFADIVEGTTVHNNLPDREAKKLQAYPKHFHYKTQENVVESNLNDNPEDAIRTVLEFVRRVIKT